MHISRLFHVGAVEAWVYRMLALAQYDHEEGMYYINRGPLWLTEQADMGVSINELHLCVGPVQLLLGRSVLA